MTWIGQAVPRKEDPRLLTGRGRFVADIQPPGVAHMVVVRSTHAHARILGVNLSEARAQPGVFLAKAARDFDPPFPRLPPIVSHPAMRHAMPYVLAEQVVRYVGEPVAVVVARNRYEAEDAAERVEVSYEELPAVVDPEAAQRADSPQLHPEAPGNVMAYVPIRVGDPGTAFGRADHVIRARLRIRRCSPQPMETRAVVVEPDLRGGRPELRVWLTTQSPHTARRILAYVLGMEEERIRVIAPDVGGGFGAKNRFYPEYALAARLALELGRPVKWVEDRVEDFLSTYQERDQIQELELALDAEGRVLGLRGRVVSDNGAYDSSFGIVPPLTTAMTLVGPYRIPNIAVDVVCVYTHKTPLAPYRGAGRPQGVFGIERLMDLAADALGLDPAELRRRNLLSPEDLPYDTGVPRRDGLGTMVYDSGDYPALFQRALGLLDYEGWRARQREAWRAGRYIGIGVVPYVEMSGLGLYETATVRVGSSGRIHVYAGCASQGQGHETVLAQIVAERLGVRFEDVEVVVGDTGLVPTGIGTFASRSAVAAGNAVREAALLVRSKALRVAAHLLEASPDDLELTDGVVRVRGAPDRAVALRTLAQLASGPNLDATRVPRGLRFSADLQPGLEATYSFDAGALNYAYGTHAAVVEVDPRTGFVRILRYVIAHDCGVELNPALVEGQVLGGFAQGIGNALYEELVWDGAGQPLVRTYADYLIPTVGEVPEVVVVHTETPSPSNPEGVKGVGEGGTMPVPAVLNAAAEDALRPFRVRLLESPLRPEHVLEALGELSPEGR
ncbi:MAG: xanthine dehydrogenase [candidate division GAL15 bacterium]